MKRLSEEEAQRVLARAAELDAALEGPSEVVALRQAAVEAGISPVAFDAAIAEVVESRMTTARRIWHGVRQNLLAAGAFVVVLELMIRPLIWLNYPGPVRTLGMLLAIIAGVVVAHRLRARLTRTLLIGLSAGQGVLFVFRLSGIAADGANVVTWSVFFTGLVAALAVAGLSRRDRGATGSASASEAQTRNHPVDADSPADHIPLRLDPSRQPRVVFQ